MKEGLSECDGRTAARIYPFVIPRDNYTSIEVHYYVYFAFNVGLLWLGKHVSDWEKVVLKFKRDESDHKKYVPYYAYATRHSPKDQSWGGNWERVKVGDETHPRVLVAAGTHAMFFESITRVPLVVNFATATDGLNFCEDGKDIKNAMLETLAPPGAGTSWKPWEVDDQRDYTIWCDHWAGGDDPLHCSYDEHPEKDVFEMFSGKYWGYSYEDQVTCPTDKSPYLDESPADIHAQFRWFFSYGVECASKNGWDRPDYCPEVYCDGKSNLHQ